MIAGSMTGFGGLAAFATMAALLAIGGSVRADESEPRRTISVVGQGEVTVAPDLAFMSLAVETNAPTAAQATSENAARSGRVVAAVKRELGEQDTLKTTGYDLQPRYADRKPGSQEMPQIVGYIARNQIRVTTRRLDAVGAILDAALGAGANRSSGLGFTIEDRNPPTRRALALAGEEARAQAESIAAALGVRLGPVLTASTSSSAAPIRPQMAMPAMRMQAAPTPIEAGDETVSATLHVTYEILDAPE